MCIISVCSCVLLGENLKDTVTSKKNGEWHLSCSVRAFAMNFWSIDRVLHAPSLFCTRIVNMLFSREYILMRLFSKNGCGKNLTNIGTFRIDLGISSWTCGLISLDGWWFVGRQKVLWWWRDLWNCISYFMFIHHDIYYICDYRKFYVVRYGTSYGVASEEVKKEIFDSWRTMEKGKAEIR